MGEQKEIFPSEGLVDNSCFLKISAFLGDRFSKTGLKEFGE